MGRSASHLNRASHERRSREPCPFGSLLLGRHGLLLLGRGWAGAGQGGLSSRGSQEQAAGRCQAEQAAVQRSARAWKHSQVGYLWRWWPELRAKSRRQPIMGMMQTGCRRRPALLSTRHTAALDAGQSSLKCCWWYMGAKERTQSRTKDTAREQTAPEGIQWHKRREAMQLFDGFVRQGMHIIHGCSQLACAIWLLAKLRWEAVLAAFAFRNLRMCAAACCLALCRRRTRGLALSCRETAPERLPRYLPCCARMMASSLGSILDSSIPGGNAVTPQAGPGGGPAGEEGWRQRQRVETRHGGAASSLLLGTQGAAGTELGPLAKRYNRQNHMPSPWPVCCWNHSPWRCGPRMREGSSSRPARGCGRMRTLDQVTMHAGQDGEGGQIWDWKSSATADVGAVHG